MQKTRIDAEDTQTIEMDGAKGVNMRILLGRKDGMENFSMRHFVVEPGGHTPRHQHDYEHEVVVHAGQGQVENDGEFAEIRSGDVLHVEPDKLHQFKNTGDEPLEFICLVPHERQGGGEVPGS